MIRITRHIITTAFVFAAVAAPASAQDLVSPDARDAANLSQPYSAQDLRSPDARDSVNSNVSNGPQDLRSPDARDSVNSNVSSGPQDLRSPDARESASFSTSPLAQQDLRSPDARDSSRPVGSNQPVRVSLPVIDDGSGFDWGDAGIGAAGMLALFALAGGTVLIVSHHRKSRDSMPVATR
jgi:hypothetical protein